MPAFVLILLPEPLKVSLPVLPNSTSQRSKQQKTGSSATHSQTSHRAKRSEQHPQGLLVEDFRQEDVWKSVKHVLWILDTAPMLHLASDAFEALQTINTYHCKHSTVSQICHHVQTNDTFTFAQAN
ncbi:hypothetical protein FOCC_FOCC008336 [Frankliniella occidentalis]|nr:hypothetical protein FOCC_FOCC008336 [Frankliniella occidentalis]